MKPTRRPVSTAEPKGVEAYLRAFHITDRDSLHEVIAREGPGILEKGLPYVLLAARWTRASAFRKDTRQRTLLERAGDAATPLPSAWDPYERATQNEQLRILLDAIGRLSIEGRLGFEDMKILWSHAQGSTDREIQSLWAEWGLTPPPPALPALRKRRQRVLGQIRRAVDAERSVSGDRGQKRPRPAGA